MSIYITGDTHGADLGTPTDGFMRRLNTASFPEQRQMTRDDYVVIIGDFGGVWHTDRVAFQESRQEKYALDWLEGKPFTTLFLPGNHENYDRLTGIRDEALLGGWMYEKMPEGEKQKLRRGYPREDWQGGTVRRIRDHIWMMEPGVFEIDGRNCFVYGGAASHDIRDGILNPADFKTEKEFHAEYRRRQRKYEQFRVRGVSWWEQEQPDQTAEQTALQALDAAGWEVDFVLTHDSATIQQIMMGYSSHTRINRFLQQIHDRVQYRHWFFGHLHENRTLPGGKDHCVYEQIVRIN